MLRDLQSIGIELENGFELAPDGDVVGHVTVRPPSGLSPIYNNTIKKSCVRGWSHLAPTGWNRFDPFANLTTGFNGFELRHNSTVIPQWSVRISSQASGWAIYRGNNQTAVTETHVTFFLFFFRFFLFVVIITVSLLCCHSEKWWVGGRKDYNRHKISQIIEMKIGLILHFFHPSIFNWYLN